MAPSDRRTVEELFAGRPAALALFNHISDYIRSLGPVEVGVTKTQVSFGVRTKFAWVWLPQLWTRKRANESVTLTFDADHRIDHPRIAQAVEPRPGRWTHHVVIEKEADFSHDVRGWLREAYRMGMIDRRKRAR